MRILCRQSKLYKNEFEYVDQRTERIYQRVIGALAWPGTRPGFAVVIAEEMVYRPPAHAYLIAEIEASHTGELLSKCTELSKNCSISAWYAQTDDKENMDFLRFYNQEAKTRRERTFNMCSAPYSDGGRITYHLNILLSRLKASDKTLHLSEQSRLPGYLMEVQASDVVKAKASDFPAVAALGYAITTLVIYEKTMNDIPKQAPEWDPFNQI